MAIKLNKMYTVIESIDNVVPKGSLLVILARTNYNILFSKQILLTTNSLEGLVLEEIKYKKDKHFNHLFLRRSIPFKIERKVFSYILDDTYVLLFDIKRV